MTYILNLILEMEYFFSDILFILYENILINIKQMVSSYYNVGTYIINS